MLLKYIHSNRIAVIVLFLLVPLLYWIPSLFQGSAVTFNQSGEILFGQWIIAFNRDFRVLASLMGMLLIIVNGYLLIQLNTVHIFIPYRTQLPLYFYIMLAVSITQLHYLSPALIASTLLLLLFYRIFSAYKVDGISFKFLDAGLLISTASLFFFPAVFFFLFLIAALLLLRPFIWREWAFAVLGMMLPYIFVLSAFYLLDIPAGDVGTGIVNSYKKEVLDFKLSEIVNWSYVLLFTVIASYYMARAIDTMKIHARKFFLVFLAYFFISLLVFLLMRGSGPGMVYFAAVPLSYLFSYYFVRCKRNWINDVFFAVFLLLLIWQRIG
jgi:hypothetical protein